MSDTGTPSVKTAYKRSTLGRAAWLSVAREALIREGIGAVQISRLARCLKVTRGGFYWFFESRRQLLDELLRDWERTNSAVFEEIRRSSRRDGLTKFLNLVDIRVQEEAYSPAWDGAMRDWARSSTRVAKIVHRADDARIALLKQLFLDRGLDEDSAFVRA